MLLILAIFLAIGVSQARLSCDGEAVSVAADTTSYGGVEFVAVTCDSIGAWQEQGEWCVASECSCERSE